MHNKGSIKVFAPATVSNVACGYDIMGFPVEGYGDTIILEEREDNELVIKAIKGADGIPFDPEVNVSAVALRKFLDTLGKKAGFDISIEKNIPPGSGLGSSASSSVGAVFGANELFGRPFTNLQLIDFSMEGERVASTKPHADNVGPSLMGGFTVIRGYDPLDVFNIPYPDDLKVVVIYPHMEVKTSDAKKMLKTQVNLSDAVKQWGNVAGLVSGLITSDYDLISRSLQDVIIEPVRSILIPYYQEIKSLAIEGGALGFNISGSGPSMFALTRGMEAAQRIKDEIEKFLHEKDIANTAFTSSICKSGARVI